MAAKKTDAGGSGPNDDGGAPAAAPYVVLARKYRPQTFADLIGQDAMVATLSNAFTSGRIAQGYMLTGVRGVGKTTTARILARALNFSRDGADDRPTVDLPRDPADYGVHCAQIMESRHPDVIEMDAASNTGIDNIREIIESARYKPLLARYKVFIIDEVHMLSKGAFNALLKTLEEPPEHVKFIFATTEIRKVPVTVLSRCQRFDLRRVDVPLLKEHFARLVGEEGAQADDDALVMIARAAGGSVRDGLSILDQAISFSKGNVSAEGVRAMLGLADRGRIFDLADTLFSGDPAGALSALEALHQDGAEPVQVLADLAEAVHVATRVKVAGIDAGGEVLSAEEKRRAASLAGSLSIPLLSRAWQMLIKGFEDVGRAPDPKAAAEMVLIRIAHTADLPSPDEVIKALGGQAVPARRNSSKSADTSASTAETAATASVAMDRSASAAVQRSDHRANPAGSPAAAPPVASAPSAPRAPSASSPPPPDIPFDAARFEAVPPWEDEADAGETDFGEFDPEDPVSASELMPAGAAMPADPRSFAEVVALVEARRDAKLKYYLEEEVSLVKFETPPPGEDGNYAIDFYLLKNAPPELPNDLREKLNKWTAHRWIVVVSKAPGEPPIGEVRRKRAAEELAELKTHPLIKAAFDVFPGADVAAVRPLDPDSEPDNSAQTGKQDASGANSQPAPSGKKGAARADKAF